MTNAKIAAAALIMVSVHDGGARVAAKGHEPVLLAKNDRTLVAPKLPPVTMRAPVKTTSMAKKPAPATATSRDDAERSTERDDPMRASTDGAIDRRRFRAAVQTVMGDIHSCYDSALADDEWLQGRAVVVMKIETRDGIGKIAEAEFVPEDGELAAPRLHECVIEALTRADFPPSPDGKPVTVRYPFQFSQ